MERRKAQRRHEEAIPVDGERSPNAVELFEEHGERRSGFDRRSGPDQAP